MLHKAQRLQNKADRVCWSKTDVHKRNLEEVFHPTLLCPQRDPQVISSTVQSLCTIVNRPCNLCQLRTCNGQVITSPGSQRPASRPDRMERRLLFLAPVLSSCDVSPAHLPVASWNHAEEKYPPNAACREYLVCVCTREVKYRRAKRNIPAVPNQVAAVLQPSASSTEILKNQCFPPHM